MAGSGYKVATIGKCVCGHSHGAHAAGRLNGCGFCGCLQFRLDHVEQEMILPRREPQAFSGGAGTGPGSDPRTR